MDISNEFILIPFITCELNVRCEVPDTYVPKSSLNSFIEDCRGLTDERQGRHFRRSRSVPDRLLLGTARWQ